MARALIDIPPVFSIVRAGDDIRFVLEPQGRLAGTVSKETFAHLKRLDGVLQPYARVGDGGAWELPQTLFLRLKKPTEINKIIEEYEEDNE